VERGVVVEVAKVELAEDRLESVGGAADVHHDAFGAELWPPELQVDDVGRPMQALRGTEELAAEAVRNHHVTSNADTEHGSGFRPQNTHFLPRRLPHAQKQRGSAAGERFSGVATRARGLLHADACVLPRWSC
jgi:hypothetical protein